MSKAIFTKEQINFMINNYETMQYKEIGNILGFTERQIRGKLNNMGYTKNRKFNNRYFQHIDTPLKAYFLGYIFADGWVCHNNATHNYEFGMELQEQDKYVLEKLNSELGGVHKIFYDNSKTTIILNHEANRGPTNILRVYSKNLVEDLISNGISTNKSQKDIIPHIENENLFFDFMRGYIDGDGCYWKIKQRPNDIYLHITCASRLVLEYLQNRLNQFNIKTQIYTEKDKKHRLMCTNYNDMKTFINKMYYKNDVFCLTRKKNKIEKYLVKEAA